MTTPKQLKEVCKNCGFTFGSHLATHYHSIVHEKHFPTGCCPGHEDRMDWNDGPGTVFEGTETFKEYK